MRYFFLLTLMVSSFLCGCKSPETTAYKSLGTVVLLVNSAKHAYEENRVALKVTPDSEARIKSAYLRYQQALKVAEDLEKSLKSTPEDATRFNAAISAVTVSANDFIEFVRLLIPSAKLTTVK